MKKLLLILLLLIIVFTGCATKEKFSEQNNLEYFVSSCISDFQNKVETFEHNWIDDTILEVKTYVEMNCGESIDNAHYKIDGTDLNLYYESPKCKINSKPFCEDCLCYKEIKYTIGRISKENFSFSLFRIK